ncbi:MULTISPECIES: ABC transporter permease [Methylococcus]|uniref:ABC transporter permease n=1 Tax=Methylococcus capsulatus TaxID=414 RepID=A0ABZ2F273_METCP|nr:MULTISPECIES: ABC transporter permease [Methylococcus]MDF9391424.1 ABC transporter permease [Methylococcus capsulatus]
MSKEPEPGRELSIESRGDVLVLILGGNWTREGIVNGDAGLADLIERIAESATVSFRTDALAAWDSTLLTFLVRIVDACRKSGVPVVLDGLPAGVQGLLKLAYAVPERQDARRTEANPGFLESVGLRALTVWHLTGSLLGFIGETSLSLLRFFAGRARFRRVDFWLFVEEAGVRALPIVTLISLLVGMILAFVGAHQLSMFGAEIYIAGAVGIGMVREMGAMMTAIIMAGRTGAAYAAQIGTMQVNQEIDALRTMGINPMDFLVLPRLLALVLMMPVLCIYADIMGIAGGALVGISTYGISRAEFLNELQKFVHFGDITVGLFKCTVFGVLVALSGCLRGMECGRSSSAVGLATTSAVVTAITLIIASDAVMTVVTTILHL